MKFSHIVSRIGLMLIPLLLAACSKKAPDAPSSATLDRTALMQLAFPGWAEKGGVRNWRLRVPPELSDEVDANKKPKEYFFNAQLDPEFVVRLSDDDASLIVLEQPLAEDGQIFECHGCRVDYGAVQFHRRDGKWFIANRQDYVGEGGQMDVGNFPKIVKLSQHAYGLKVDMFYAQSGMELHSTELFELTPNGPRAPLSMPLSVNDDGALRFADDDSGATVNCEKMPSKKQTQHFIMNGDFECYHLDAKWSVDDKGETPGDVIVQYKGLIRTEDDDKVHRFHPINERMVWKYQDGKYVHVSGVDPTKKLTF